jgi:hypothetical protein
MVQVSTLTLHPYGGNSSLSLSSIEDQQCPDDRLCTIQRDEGGTSTVFFHETGPHLQRQQSELKITESYQFHHCIHTVGNGDKRLNKLIRKGQGALQKLVDFAEAVKQSASGSSYSLPFPAKSGAVRALPGNTAFVWNPAASGGKQSNTFEVFSELRLHTSDGNVSSQYYHCRSSAIKTEWLNSSSGKGISSIYVNSGLCLYSKFALGLDDRDPTGEPSLPLDAKPTLYEIEIIARTASAIADWVTLLRGEEGSNTVPRCPLSINIDVPDFQYYWHACELLERNIVSMVFVEAWITLIDKWRGQLGKVILSAINELLEERHIHRGIAGNRVELNLTSGTESATIAIKDSISRRRIPTVEEVLSALQNDSHDGLLWREFLANLSPKYYPDTLLELGRLAYVFKVVKPALAPKLANNERTGLNVIFQVDDVIEWKIYEQAKMFLKSYGPNDRQNATCMLGVFPLQRIFVAGKGRSCLYVNDPGPHLYQKSGDKNARALSPLEVVQKCYGSRIGGILERLLREQGLV